MSYSLGGGGGVAGTDTATAFALDQPYELAGDWSPEQVDQLNEMLSYLFKASTKTTAQLVTVTETFGTVLKVGFSPNVSQMKTLSTAPVTIVPGVAGKIIVPIYWSLYETRFGGDTFDSSPTFTLRWSGVVTDILLSIAMIAGATTNTTRFNWGGQAGTNSSTATNGAILAGAALTLRSNTNFGVTIGNGSNCTWRFEVAYYLSGV